MYTTVPTLPTRSDYREIGKSIVTILKDFLGKLLVSSVAKDALN